MSQVAVPTQPASVETEKKAGGRHRPSSHPFARSSDTIAVTSLIVDSCKLATSAGPSGGGKTRPALAVMDVRPRWAPPHK